MGVAVVVALAPLPVRGQEVEGVDSSCRPLGSLLVPCAVAVLSPLPLAAWGLSVWL